MYKHPLSLFCSTHIKVGHRVHDALLFSRSTPSRDSGCREMVVNGVMIGKMIEGRLKFPSSLNHGGSAPEKTLAANGVRSHAWEFEAWVMLAVDTPDTDWNKKDNTLKEKTPLRVGSKVIVPRPQIHPNSLGFTLHRKSQVDPGNWWFLCNCNAEDADWLMVHQREGKNKTKQRNKEREQSVEQEQAKGTLGTWWCCQCLM